MTELDRKPEKPHPKVFHPGLALYLVPLIALFLGAGIGKWVSLRINLLLPSAEARMGITASRLLLGSDNPSLILGCLFLILSFAAIRSRTRIKTAGADQPENPGRVSR